MKKIIAIVAATLFVLNIAAVGTWKNYLAYSSITDVQQGGTMVYVLASGGLYTYNTTDQSITTYDKASGLNDCEIGYIAWCQAAKRLIIVYSNGNIDFLDQDGTVTNLSDYYDKALTYSKTINGVDIINQYAYLSTSFGIVKVNVSKMEIAESYILGFSVNYCYIDGNTIYAASSANGTYAASTADNLLDPASWSYVAAYTKRTTTIVADLKALAQSLSPGGPEKNIFYYITYEQDRLYSAGGYFMTGLGEDLNDGTVQIMQPDGEWISCTSNYTALTGYKYKDLNCVAADPTDPNHVFAAGKPGLFEFQDGEMIAYYTSENSPLLRAYEGSKLMSNNYNLVHTLYYDTDGSLWMINSQTLERSILELTASGEWVLHDQSALISGSYGLPCMTGLTKDSRGLFWFVNNHYTLPSFYAYQPSTESLNSYFPTTNQPRTTIELYYVRCIAEDLNGDIWVGTDVGPIVLYSQYITADEPVYTQVKVPRNDGTNYADYLLSGVDITAIAIDGGNRKWFGTAGNGVYLISDDGLTQVQHFTAADSPLLSDNVTSIAINGDTGEVFFATSKGLCSYMSDATTTASTMKKSEVYAYPNPVRPDYTGLITITGLTLDADVKILAANGKLVNEGRSTGGLYTWDGCAEQGRRSASGV